jgi:hypothetical protein
MATVAARASACAWALAICWGGACGPSSGANPTGPGAGGSSGSAPDGAVADATSPTPGAHANPYIFVIAMENHGAGSVYGSSSAPYINGTLVPRYARASAFAEELTALPSEPHYVFMEAGTNAFSDHVFTTDDAPSAGNSTASSAHLVSQIRDAGAGLDWMAYMEGMVPSSQACPLQATGFYTPAHQPFVFFQDVAGAPPSTTNALCAAHHRPLTALAGDLASGAVKSYSFISPDVCHDMHGDPGCPSTDTVRMGDDWLAANLPPLISFVGAHGGVVFITWDEGGTLPFLAIGPHVKAGYASGTSFDHGSIVKSVEQMLGLPILGAVASSADLGDLFAPGYYP